MSSATKTRLVVFAGYAVLFIAILIVAAHPG